LLSLTAAWTSAIEGQPPPSQHASTFCRQSAHHQAERIQNSRCGLPVNWQIMAAILIGASDS
jgi:hypothetical protein